MRKPSPAELKTLQNLGFTLTDETNLWGLTVENVTLSVRKLSRPSWLLYITRDTDKGTEKLCHLHKETLGEILFYGSTLLVEITDPFVEEE